MGVVYKYSAGMDALTRFLEDRTIRFTPPGSLNDPFECGLYTDVAFDAFGKGPNQRYLSGLKVSAADVRHFNAYWIRAIAQRTNDQAHGILSLAQTGENLLMWSHYADQHRGFVLGFDRAHTFFNPSEDDGRSRLVPVRYSEKRILSGLRKGTLFRHGEISQELEYTIFNDFFLKSPEWSYEKEIRMVAMLNKTALFPADGIRGVTRFPAEAIVEIIVGSRAKFETIKRIYELHATNFPHARLLVAWPDPHRFRVNTRLAPPLDFMERVTQAWDAPILPPSTFES